MWIDAEGVVHTVALPDPTDVMTDRFKTSLDLLIARDSEAIAELIEVEQHRFFDDEPVTIADEDEYEGLAPPLGLMDRTVRSKEDLRATIEEVDIRWRLDVPMALEDYVG